MTTPGWPAVEPVPRVGRWCVTVVLVIATVLLVATPFVGLPESMSVWGPVVAAIGLLVSAVGVVSGWWMLLRGTLHRPVRGLTPGTAGSRTERRRLRRVLLAGGELDDDDRRRIAAGIASTTTVRWVAAVFAAIFGTNAATSTRGMNGSTVDAYLLVLSAVPALVLLAMAGLLLWQWPVMRAAAAAGALPVVEPAAPHRSP